MNRAGSTTAGARREKSLEDACQFLKGVGPGFTEKEASESTNQQLAAQKTVCAHSLLRTCM